MTMSHEKIGQPAFQNMNTENVQSSNENRGPLAIANTRPSALEY